MSFAAAQAYPAARLSLPARTDAAHGFRGYAPTDERSQARRPSVGTSALDSYCRALEKSFAVEASKTMTTTTLKTGQFAAARISSAMPGVGMTAPMPAENAYLIALQLRDAAGNELWKSGRKAPGAPFLAGTITIADLKDEPAFNFREPFDCLLICVPQVAFDELADGYGARRIRRLSETIAAPDPVVDLMGRALLPALTPGGDVPQLFFDNIVFAIYSHLASRHGSSESRLAPRSGGLTRRQMQLANDALTADLHRETDIAAAALACGVPVNRFARAFRQTTGMPPHRWVRQFRVERAKELLLGSTLTLGQIAYECGFADQSHFTRVFSAAAGATPGEWRRIRRD